MTPNDIAGLVGAALAGAAGTGVLFVKHVLPLFKKRDDDVKAIKEEIGVGVGSDTMAELVMSTSAAVRRIEEDGARNWNGITEVLRVQEAHGLKLDLHDRRFESIEKEHGLIRDRFSKIICLSQSSVDCDPSGAKVK